MDTKSKTLFILMAIACVISVSITYYRTIVLEDFEITDVSSEEEEEVFEEDEEDIDQDALDEENVETPEESEADSEAEVIID